MQTQPLLAIRCITYNHEPYIRQCLEGFVMQKTNFPFIAIVHDDASTDGTAKIIQEYAEKYPDIIRPIYETENQYSKHDGSLARIMNEAVPKDVKYIAMCEGDDYWIDPNKLQMQVDFLEKNPEYGMCYTKAKQYIQDKQKFVLKSWGENVYGFTYLLKTNNKIPTLTACYRYNLYKQYYKDISPSTKNWLMGDYPMWLWFSYNTKIKFFNYNSGVYRVLSDSASHSNSCSKVINFSSSLHDIKDYFSQKYLQTALPPFDRQRREINFLISHGYRKDAIDKIQKLSKLQKTDKVKLFICQNSFFYCIFVFLLQRRQFFRNRQ